MRRTRIHVVASRVHKWLALIIGAQLLIWFTSGVLMSFLPIEKVRGEHLVDRERAAALPADLDFSRLSNAVNAGFGKTRSIHLTMIDGRVVARLEGTAVNSVMVDAVTGIILPPLDAASSERIARSAWLGDKKVSATALKVTEESTEYRGGLPAWQVSLSDPEKTRIYVEANTGRIAAVRNGTWRLYDFFWGLHIMDWKNHEDFNTPWLLAFAVGGLVLGIAGTFLLVIRWPFRRKLQAKPQIAGLRK